MQRLLLLLLLASCLVAQPVLLNSATAEHLATLPLTEEQVDDLYLFVKFQGPVTSIYDLGRIPGFDSATIEKLKPLVSLELPPKKVFASRLQDSYRRVEDWTSEEGANEGLIELWLDPNIYKNALAVAIPGTDGETGIDLAAALGYGCGDPALKLQVLEPVTNKCLAKAKSIVQEGRVKIRLLADKTSIYIKASVKTE